MSWAQQALEEAESAGRTLVEPPCAYQAECGGCSWQTLSYDDQRALKQQFIRDCFEQAGFEGLDVPLPIASPTPYAYRNKMEFTFSARRWFMTSEIESGDDLDRHFALGLHAPGGFDRVLDIDRCGIQTEAADRALAATRAFARASGRPPYDQRTHEGFWRFCVLRSGINTGQLQITIYTREDDPPLIDAYVAHLLEAGVPVTSVAHAITDRVADTTEGATLRMVHGPDHLRERVGALEFDIAPQAFFQPNTRAAELLFDLVAEYAAVEEGSRVLDLFAGAGSLSLWMARRGAHVHGWEIVEPAVVAAKRNAAQNGLEAQCTFEVRDLDAGLPGDIPPVDVVVTDPPRAGMHERLLRALRTLAPPRLVSVGCNPKTQALNLAWLCSTGEYRVSSMQAVDQFPQTPHVENVALLERC